MSTKATQIQSPLCALLVDGDPAKESQGVSNECAGASLLLSELGLPFEYAGFVKKGSGEEQEGYEMLAEKYPTIAPSVQRIELPLLVYTPNGSTYCGVHQIIGFLKNLPLEVTRTLNRAKIEALCRDVERKVGDLELGALDSDENKIISDVRKIIAHGADEKELPAWLDLIQVLRGLETHLETIGYMHPAEMVFLNVNNPAVPSPTDCFLAPILYYTELALSNVKKWDMVRDHKFTHLKKYLDGWQSRDSWRLARIDDRQVIDALTGLHRRASMGELEGDYGKKRVDAAVAGSTMMEQLGVSRSG